MRYIIPVLTTVAICIILLAFARLAVGIVNLLQGILQ